MKRLNVIRDAVYVAAEIVITVTLASALTIFVAFLALVCLGSFFTR